MQSYSEEPGSTWPQLPGSVASLEQTQEVPAWEQTSFPDTSSQSTLPPQTPHMSMQVAVEPVVPQSYSGEELGSQLQQPGSAAGLRQTQEMSTWDWTLYSNAPSKFTLSPSSARLEIPPHVPSQASMYGELAAGPSTSAWPLEQFDPYPMTNASALGVQAHAQGYHSPHDQYGQHRHDPPTPPASTVLLGQPELAQLGLFPQESGLGQLWVSLMRQSGYFDMDSYER